MASIKYFIQSKKNPATIYVRFRSGREIDAKAKTQYYINIDEWNKSKGMPILKSESAKQIHVDLLSLSQKIIQAYNGNSLNVNIDSNWLINIIIKKEEKNELPNTLVEYIDYYARVKKNDIQIASFKKIKVNQNLLRRFEVQSKLKILIHEVNEQFQLRFEDYCYNNGYSTNTIARLIKFIKGVCNHARRNGLKTHNQLENLKKKNEEVLKVSLTNDEIKLIINTKFDHDYLENAKDWLIISCETGQRVSDFLNFKKEQIRFIEDKPILEFVQVKTKKKMAIALNSRLMGILEKRNGEFPRKISDQKYNLYIKEVCKIAGINEKVKGSKKDPDLKRKKVDIYEKWELVSSHIGRRSFATNYFNKIPTSILMYATGHTTERQFYEYVGKRETELAMQLSNYYKKLEL